MNRKTAVCGMILGILFVSGCTQQGQIPDAASENSRCAAENEMCGGIAGILCCDGLSCKLDGTYPDASGKCEKSTSGNATGPKGARTSYVKINSLEQVKKIEFTGARPEIVEAGGMVFIVYLETSKSGTSFKLRIYDHDMTNVLVEKTLVSRSEEYGSPTDIRIIKDGEYLYVAYELGANSKTNLFAAKYTLDKKFERVEYTGPISSSTIFLTAKFTDEKLDDPAPMIVGDDFYIMTRFKYSLAKEGDTIYKLYKFDKDLKKISDSILDLSDYADGCARQSSIIYEEGYYYIAMQTTVGDGNINELAIWSAPSDILMLKLDKNFKVVESKTIANETGYTEAYVTGLKSDDKYFYVTYNKVILGKGFTSVIKIFDKSWNEVLKKDYKSYAQGLRPSIEVTADRIYAGNDEQGQNKAEIYLFEKK